MTEYVRAPKEQREFLVGFVQQEMSQPLGSTHLTRRPDQEGAREIKFDMTIVGKPCLLTVRMGDFFRLQFFKVYPKSWGDEHWGAYWVNGNGMKIYGNYEAFEKDVLFLKMQS